MLQEISFADGTRGADAVELLRGKSPKALTVGAKTDILSAANSALTNAARRCVELAAEFSAGDQPVRVAVVVLPDSAAGAPRLLPFARAVLSAINSLSPELVSFDVVSLLRRDADTLPRWVQAVPPTGCSSRPSFVCLVVCFVLFNPFSIFAPLLVRWLDCCFPVGQTSHLRSFAGQEIIPLIALPRRTRRDFPLVTIFLGPTASPASSSWMTTSALAGPLWARAGSYPSTCRGLFSMPPRLPHTRTTTAPASLSPTPQERERKRGGPH